MSLTFNEVFDASQVAPQQAGGKHKPGNKWSGSITAAKIEETKSKDGGMYVVTFTSPGGSIDFRYNLWNASEQARNIARGQLSALCHAIGIFQINFANGGQNIVNSKLMYDVGFQAGQEPSADKPEGGYVEVKKVYDINGNEPGVSGGGQQQQMTQQPQTNQQTNQPQTNNAGGGWQPSGGPVNNQQTNQPQGGNGQSGGWSQNNQGGAAGGGAPWKQ